MVETLRCAQSDVRARPNPSRLPWPINHYRTMRPRHAPILAALLCAHSALAETGNSNRILRNMDFEERRLGNSEELPMHWLKVEGANLPHYVNGRLATDAHHSGQYSFKLDLNGGGLIYRYDWKQLPVQPGAHYRVDAMVKTTALPNARARMTAYFVNVDGKPIPSPLRQSDLYAAASESDPWHPVHLALS